MSSPILKILKQAIALLLVYALPAATCPLQTSMPAQSQPQQQWTAATPVATPDSPKIANDQLDSLVAPIALYPDPLLAQMLVASTYPLEIIQLQQWLDRNQGLKDQALVDAVEKQDWDASIQALAPLPDVVKILSENIKWTTQLGDAFLAQQGDTMDAVQRMRMKAKNSGQLKSTEQQKVETKVVEQKTVVVIEPSSPDVIYVPSYDPMVVYGAPVYPYPPMYYPPGYYAAGMALSFGVGMAIGAAWGGGGYGWGCGWGGGNNVYINNHNNFINNQNLKNANFNRDGNQAGRGNSNWQHNPDHRGGTPYGNRDTANRFGGTTRGDSAANRQASARQNQSRGLQQAGMRDGGPGGMDRGRAGASTMDRGAGFGGGGDRVGGRDVSRGSGSGAFGGAGSGMSGRSAQASQSRGASSMSRGSSGGFGGGGRSGGGRSGGGGRRR
jgi:hypothetical protein